MYEQEDKPSIIFISNATEFNESIQILKRLLNCIEMKLDFPYECKI